MTKISLPIGDNSNNPDATFSNESNTTDLNLGGKKDDTTGDDKPGDPPANDQTPATLPNEGGDKGADKGDTTKPTNLPDLTEGQVLEVDGVDFTIAADGSAKDASGKILTTAEVKELLANAQQQQGNPNEEILDITSLQEAVGITIKDEKGKPVTYANDKTGLTQYITDAAEVRANELVNDKYRQFFEQNPDIYQAYVQKLKTGSIDGFTTQPQWKQFDTNAASEQELEQLITAHRKAIGDDADTTADIIASAKAKQNLAGYAEKAKAYFVAKEEADAKLVQETEAAQKAKETKELNEYWNKIDNTVKTGKLKIEGNEFTIPETIRVKDDSGKVLTYTKNDFLAYIKDVKTFTVEGNKVKLTQHQYDLWQQSQKRTPAHDVLDAFKTFVKDDMSQLINRTINDREVKKIVIKTSAKPSSNANGQGNKIKLPIQ